MYCYPNQYLDTSAAFCAGVVETLVKTGRQTDAVHFASAFQLTESFPPVPLLKEYLNSVKRSSQENSGDAVAVAGQVCIYIYF